VSGMPVRRYLFQLSDLSLGFVKDYGDCGSEVERAGRTLFHGDTDGAVIEPLFGQTPGFGTEDEKVVRLEFDAPRRFFSFGAEKPNLCFRVGGEKLVEVVPDVQIDVFPVVEAGTAD